MQAEGCSCGAAVFGLVWFWFLVFQGARADPRGESGRFWADGTNRHQAGREGDGGDGVIG